MVTQHTKVISSGPLVRQMVVKKMNGDDKDLYQVFALCKHDEMKRFKKDTHYLYEVLKLIEVAHLIYFFFKLRILTMLTECSVYCW